MDKQGMDKQGMDKQGMDKQGDEKFDMDFSYNKDVLLRIQDIDKERAMKHYGVSARSVADGMDNIREWFKMQPHLPDVEIGDNFLFRQMFTKGFTTERTKETLDNYYSARTLLPEFTHDRDPLLPEIQKVFEVVQFISLPQRTEEGYRVTIMRLLDPDHTKFNMWVLFKVAFMIGDYRMYNDMAFGEHWILDVHNATLGLMGQFTPSLVTKSLFYIQQCLGARIKGVHMVGMPSYGEAVLGMFKRGLKPKIANRINTYHSFEDLKNMFPAKIMPKDLGGEERNSFEISDDWRKTLSCPVWRKWFIEQEHIKSDESKRLSKQTHFEELNGLQGSFRVLDID